MNLTQQQIELVSESFQKIIPISAQAAELFYSRLFEIAPETQALFNATHMKVQGNKLMSTIGAAVTGLRNMDDLVPVVRNLGKRHLKYQVTDERPIPLIRTVNFVPSSTLLSTLISPPMISIMP